MKIDEFRDGIFALRTRRFGSVAEIMIKKIYKLDDSHTIEYDKFDNEGAKRIEVKFSTVMRKNSKKINENNVISQCLEANVSNRAIAYLDIKKCKFDCNIQQIKCHKFDVLYYGLFFADEILLFKMSSKEVKQCKGYSDKQHAGNIGEGQFHINNDTLEYHLENYLIKKLTYKELYNILK